jgi:hypothetical protein
VTGCGDGENGASDDIDGITTSPDAPAAPSEATRSFFPSPGGRRAVVWAVGDGAKGESESRRVASMVAKDRPRAFLYLGDVYEDGTPRSSGRTTSLCMATSPR